MSVHDHHWDNHGRDLDPENMYGFVYMISNETTGQMYIGRKFYKRYRNRKPVGENDWHFYIGSSKAVHADIKKYGIENFSFIILGEYATRAEVMYYEANFMHKMDVLLQPDIYYNRTIPGIKFTMPKGALK